MIVSQCLFIPYDGSCVVKPSVMKKAMALNLSVVFPGPQNGFAHSAWIDKKSRFIFFYYRTGFSITHCLDDGFSANLGFVKCETGYSDI